VHLAGESLVPQYFLPDAVVVKSLIEKIEL